MTDIELKRRMTEEILDFVAAQVACLQVEAMTLGKRLDALEQKSEADSALWHEMEERLAALEQYIGDEK